MAKIVREENEKRYRKVFQYYKKIWRQVIKDREKGGDV